MAIVPCRGPWEYERFATTSAATFVSGSLVKLNAQSQLSEYSGGEASFLGVALHSSANSNPAGYVLVALPSARCTARVDVPAGVAASSLSIGLTVGIYKSGNTVSLLTTSFTSSGGRIAVIRGILDSAKSTIEVEFLKAGEVFDSSASQTLVN